MPRPPAPEVKKVSGSGPPMGLVAGVVVLVVALIGGLVFWAVTSESSLEAAGSQNALPEGGGISIGAGVEADVPQIDLYEDFQCRFCGELEGSIGDELARRAGTGEVNVRFTLMSFLEGGPDGQSSRRAAGAALCADDADSFLDYHSVVFANLPEEQGTGWTDEQLLGFAEQAGVSGADLDTFTSCFESDTYEDYVDAMQERANRDGVTSTPSLSVDGDPVDAEQLSVLMRDAGALEGLLDPQP